jgi:hypothetical protein
MWEEATEWGSQEHSLFEWTVHNIAKCIHEIFIKEIFR